MAACQRLPNDFPMLSKAFLMDCSTLLSSSASTAVTAPHDPQVSFGLRFNRPIVSGIFLPHFPQGMSSEWLSRLKVMSASIVEGLIVWKRNSDTVVGAHQFHRQLF